MTNHRALAERLAASDAGGQAMTDDITQRLRAAVPKMPDSGTPIAWPCKVRSELLLEAAAEIERLREALQESACACSSIRECASEWAKDGKCPHLIARVALEGKP